MVKGHTNLTITWHIKGRPDSGKCCGDVSCAYTENTYLLVYSPRNNYWGLKCEPESKWLTQTINKTNDSVCIKKKVYNKRRKYLNSIYLEQDFILESVFMRMKFASEQPESKIIENEINVPQRRIHFSHVRLHLIAYEKKRTRENILPYS